MRRLIPLLLLLLPCCASTRRAPSLADLRQQVRETELAFAATMADRDLEGFTSFLSDDAIFFGGPEPLRGKAAVAAGWEPLFRSSKAPFSWRPDTVEVLDSRDLALSSGPVIGATGVQTGRYTSIWRREPQGWRIVLDKSDGK